MSKKTILKPSVKHTHFLASISVAVFLIWSGAFGDQPAAATDPQAWKINKIATNHQVEGYALQTSVVSGGSISFAVSCRASSYFAVVYRMGYYNGAGAKQMASLSGRACKFRGIPAPSADTGMVNPAWPVSFTLNTTKQWQSGFYLVKLVNNEGYKNYIPFVVRPQKPQNKILFLHAANTDNAYNTWGGNSLYSGTTPALRLGHAVKLSFNRPLWQLDGNKDGSGSFLKWEYPMIKFLEKNGYSVDYASDVDVAQNPDLLKQYKTVIMAGHNEYWSLGELNSITSAATQGSTNLAIFAANTFYRPIRYEGAGDRIIVDYKNADLDPISQTKNKNQTTAYSWRFSPLNRPESKIMGLAYSSMVADDEGLSAGNYVVSAPLVVNDETNFMFDSTGLHNGDSFNGLVGYEYDALKTALPHPANIDLTFRSPLINYQGFPDEADSGYFSFTGHGQVFDAGTMEWSWALDPDLPTYSPALEQVTKNILNHFDQ